MNDYLIIGGGIRNGEQANKILNAGADIITFPPEAPSATSKTIQLG